MAEPSELTEAQRRHLDELIARYGERTAGSLARAREHRARRVETRMRSVRPETLPLAYPIVGSRADGARFWDVDGNEYVDIAMGVGVLLCGHNPPFVTDAVAEQLSRGIQTGPTAELADEVAEAICAMTGAERLFFGVTGSCAVTGALRVAQAATGRSRFVMFAGSYHGQNDRVLAVPDVLEGTNRSVPSAPGISPAAVEDALVLTYGSRKSLELIEAHADELAGVLVEPVQSRNPQLQPRDYLHELRRLTERLDIPLIFDEVITGFRVHPGGAQAWFGIEADICAYGKCIGGGQPTSVVAGKARYLDRVDGGAWEAAPGAPPADGTTYIGSTFEMHPLAMAASHAMVQHLRAEGPALQERLNARTAALAEELNGLFDREEVPIRVLQFSSMFRFAWKGNASYAYQPLAMEVFHLHMIERGIYIWEGRTCFLSTAHTSADLERVVAAAADAVAAMRAGGFLPGAGAGEDARAGAGSAPTTVPASEEQRALLELEAGDGPSWLVAERVRLRGPLDMDALRAAMRALVQRHESLRTTFPAGLAEQRIQPDSEVDLEEIDLRGEEEPALDEWLEAEMARPFDVGAGPLLRAYVLSLADEIHDLVLVAHHLVSDGWSSTVVVEELAALYSARCEGRAAALGTPQQARDFSRRQEQQRDSAEMANHRAYWLERFAGGFSRSAFAADPRRAGHRGARHASSLDGDLAAAVAEAGRAHRCTLFMTLLAAHSLAVHALTGTPEIVIGTPTAGRSYKGSESIVGYCTHLLPIRTTVAASTTLSDHLAQTRQAVVEAFAHQDFPFARLRAAMSPEGGPFPLDTIFNLDRPMKPPAFHALEAEFRRVPSAFALVPLRLDALEADGTVWLDCDYSTVCFDEAAARAFCDGFRAVLEAIASDASQTFGDLSPFDEKASSVHDYE